MRLRLFYRSSVWCVLEFTARSPSLCGISMLGVTSRCYATHKINTLCVAAFYSRMAPINNSLHKNLWLNKRTEFTLKIEGLELKSHDDGIYFFIFLLYTSVLNQNSMGYLSKQLWEFVFQGFLKRRL